MRRMRNRLLALLASSSLAVLAITGCSSVPPPPSIVYPVTYQIQVGNTQVNSTSGPANTNIAASQVAAVIPGAPLYYQVVSPVIVVVTAYERAYPNDPASRRQVGQMQGTTFTSSIVPTTGTMEFTFAVAQTNSSGVLQFTLSDHPIAPVTAP
jgi:hypothetical protein